MIIQTDNERWMIIQTDNETILVEKIKSYLWLMQYKKCILSKGDIKTLANDPTNIYLSKVNYRNTRKSC